MPADSQDYNLRIQKAENRIMKQKSYKKMHIKLRVSCFTAEGWLIGILELTGAGAQLNGMSCVGQAPSQQINGWAWSLIWQRAL